MNEYEKAYLRGLLQPLPVTPTADVMRFVDAMTSKWWRYGVLFGVICSALGGVAGHYWRAS